MSPQVPNLNKPEKEGTEPEQEDPEASAQAHINAVAGACLAMGMRFAGTADPAAKETLLRTVTTYLNHKMQAPDPNTGEQICSSLARRQLNPAEAQYWKKARSIVSHG